MKRVRTLGAKVGKVGLRIKPLGGTKKGEEAPTLPSKGVED